MVAGRATYGCSPSHIWLQALLHLKTGVVQSAAGEGSFTVKLDSPVTDDESGMGLEVGTYAYTCVCAGHAHSLAGIA